MALHHLADSGPEPPQVGFRQLARGKREADTWGVLGRRIRIVDDISTRTGPPEVIQFIPELRLPGDWDLRSSRSLLPTNLTLFSSFLCQRSILPLDCG